MTSQRDESTMTGTALMSGSAASRFRKRDIAATESSIALVHVHVDELGAGLDLLAGDLDRLLERSSRMSLRELARAGDVRPLADVDEEAAGLRDRQRLEAGQACPRRDRRDARGARPSTAVGDGPDVRGRRAAAAADDVDAGRRARTRRAARPSWSGVSS